MERNEDRVNLLLVEDCYSNVGVIRSALDAAGTRCRLQTVGVGADVLRYLRRLEPYADAPAPDLLLFDLSIIDSASLALLKQIRSDTALAEIPVVLLIDPGSGQRLEQLAGAGGDRQVFSPIDLGSFVRAMNSFKLDRFVHAVKLIGSLGYVLVTLPAAGAAGGQPAAGT